MAPDGACELEMHRNTFLTLNPICTVQSNFNFANVNVGSGISLSDDST